MASPMFDLSSYDVLVYDALSVSCALCNKSREHRWKKYSRFVVEKLFLWLQSLKHMFLYFGGKLYLFEILAGEEGTKWYFLGSSI